MKLETEIWVINCPLLKEDGADDTRAAISFCQQCEYHASFNLFEVECNYDKEG